MLSVLSPIYNKTDMAGNMDMADNSKGTVGSNI